MYNIWMVISLLLGSENSENYTASIDDFELTLGKPLVSANYAEGYNLGIYSPSFVEQENREIGYPPGQQLIVVNTIMKHGRHVSPYPIIVDVISGFNPRYKMIDLDKDGVNEFALTHNAGAHGSDLILYQIQPDNYGPEIVTRIPGANIRSDNSNIKFLETDEGIVIETLSTWLEEEGTYSKYIDQYRLIDGEIVNIQSVKTLHNTENDG